MGFPAKKIHGGGPPKRASPQGAKPGAGKQAPPKIIRLEKGDVLFREGDRSRAMYILKEGSLRLFKKKGRGVIELAVIHRGEVIGELAFFDGEARSASAEALSMCQLIMISFDQMEKQLNAMPPWLKNVITSVVKRLRQTTTKVKQLETSSITYGGSNADSYQYLSLSETVKLLSALILTAERYGKKKCHGRNRCKPWAFSVHGRPGFWSGPVEGDGFFGSSSKWKTPSS